MFDSGDGPGRDSSGTNGTVRAGDTVTYNFQFSIDGAGVTNPVLRSELPRGMSWNSVPVECSRAGFVHRLRSQWLKHSSHVQRALLSRG